MRISSGSVVVLAQLCAPVLSYPQITAVPAPGVLLPRDDVQCTVTSKSKTPPKLNCGVKGSLKNPTVLESHTVDLTSTSPLNDCRDICLSNTKCVSFSFDSSNGQCSLFQKKLVDQKLSKNAASPVTMFNRRCFTSVCSTATPTPTDSATPTDTSTSTDSVTPTDTSTSTDSATPTDTSTSTDSATPTETSTSSDSVTPTDSSTTTSTDTSTPTDSATPTDSDTVTPTETSTSSTPAAPSCVAEPTQAIANPTFAGNSYNEDGSLVIPSWQVNSQWYYKNPKYQTVQYLAFNMTANQPAATISQNMSDLNVAQPYYISLSFGGINYQRTSCSYNVLYNGEKVVSNQRLYFLSPSTYFGLDGFTMLPKSSAGLLEITTSCLANAFSTSQPVISFFLKEVNIAHTGCPNYLLKVSSPNYPNLDGRFVQAQDHSATSICNQFLVSDQSVASIYNINENGNVAPMDSLMINGNPKGMYDTDPLGRVWLKPTTLTSSYAGDYLICSLGPVEDTTVPGARQLLCNPGNRAVDNWSFASQGDGSAGNAILSGGPSANLPTPANYYNLTAPIKVYAIPLPS